MHMCACTQDHLLLNFLKCLELIKNKLMSKTWKPQSNILEFNYVPASDGKVTLLQMVSIPLHPLSLCKHQYRSNPVESNHVPIADDKVTFLYPQYRCNPVK